MSLYGSDQKSTFNPQGNLRAEQLIASAKAQASRQEQPEYPQIARGYGKRPWARSGNPSSLAEIDAEDAALNDWVRSNGYFIEAAEVDRVSLLADKIYGGQEHDVWAFLKGNIPIVIRRTRHGGYGLVGRTPVEYFDRWRLSNIVFPDTAVSFIGYTKDGRGNGVILTAQRYFEGHKRLEKEINKAMATLGFVRMAGGEPSYHKPK